jgi:uncharacterized delta-60 repeat protein
MKPFFGISLVKIFILLFVGCVPFSTNPLAPNEPLSNLLLLLRLQPRSGFQPAKGEIDTSFGNNGVQITAITADSVKGGRLALDPEGNIYQLAVSTFSGDNSLHIIGHTGSGARNTSFGDQGIVSQTLASNPLNPDIIYFPEGDLILSYNDGTIGFLAKRDRMGALVNSFGSAGIQALPGSAVPIALKLAPSGFLFTCGSENSDSFITKHHPGSGALVENFGSSGRADFDLSGILELDGLNDILVRSGDSLLGVGYFDPSGGYGDNESFAAQIQSNGLVDPNFGSSGVVRPNIFGGELNSAQSMDVDSSGKIYFVGSVGGGKAFIAKLNANGSVDSGFANSGIRIFTPPVPNFTFIKVIVQPDGNVLIGGYDGPPSSIQPAILRLTPNGDLDPSFGNKGRFNLNLGTVTSLTAMNLQPDGKILISGSTDNQVYIARIQ